MARTKSSMPKKNFNLELYKCKLKEKGLTTKVIAEKIGVSQATIGAWWRNESTPSGPNQDNLCKLLGIEPSALWMDSKGHTENFSQRDNAINLCALSAKMSFQKSLLAAASALFELDNELSTNMYVSIPEEEITILKNETEKCFALLWEELQQTIDNK